LRGGTVTIRTDLDAAIDASQACGTGLASMRLRMGPGARQALVAASTDDMMVAIGDDGEPYAYSGVPIEAVEPPSQNAPATDARFHGWQLVTR
jgi:hypothetical protein